MTSPPFAAPVQLMLRLQLWPSETQEEEQRTRETLETYVRELVEDLRLPAHVKVETVRNAQGIPARWPYLLTIDGERMRLDLLAPARTLAERVRHDVYLNRELLITRAVTRVLCSAWWPGVGGETLEMGALTDALRGLATRNLRPERLRLHYPNPPGPGQLTLEKLIFQVHRDEALTLEVRLNPQRWRQLPPDQEAMGEKAEATMLELGVPCPRVDWCPEVGLTWREYRLLLNDLRLPRSTAPEEDFLGHISQVLGQTLSHESLSLVTGDTMTRGLALLRRSSPLVVDEVVRQYGEPRIGWVMASLVEEGISIRDIQRILGAMALVDGISSVDTSRYVVFESDASLPLLVPDRRAGHPEAVDLLELVRSELQRYISDKFTQRSETTSPDQPGLISLSSSMTVILMHPLLEDRVAMSLPLEEEEHEALVEDVLGTVEKDAPLGPVIILTTRNVRRNLWEAIHRELPSIRVLSYQELLPDISLIPKARVEPRSSKTKLGSVH